MDENEVNEITTKNNVYNGVFNMAFN